MRAWGGHLTLSTGSTSGGAVALIRFSQWGVHMYVTSVGGGWRNLSVPKGEGGAWPHPLPLGDAHGGVSQCLLEHCHMYTAYTSTWAAVITIATAISNTV